MQLRDKNQARDRERHTPAPVAPAPSDPALALQAAGGGNQAVQAQMKREPLSGRVVQAGVDGQPVLDAFSRL